MKGNLWAWCVKTWLHWFSHTITMIKPCFNTELRVLSASALPRDIPKINHKFTSQSPLWNCVRLQIPYQIIDRILFYSGLHFQVLCAACSFVWEDLYKFSQFFFFCLFVSEILSQRWAHVYCAMSQEQSVNLRFSSVCFHRGLLSQGSAHFLLLVRAIHLISTQFSRSSKSCHVDMQVRPWIFMWGKKEG